ncbi:2'-5' RNA ligase family protein [Nocardioides sp.]|uniref:2'-5' RNA ligase family protein n=1 Tax=Nocardioides sp. TaxID=35761 RepID=UPI002D7E2743|nr:2'-5' RNA ligase family protein [Nocardioides sp.]HET8959479.1 2'-5' RNA ligase family protein [Nocardioides sp.]
MSLAVCLLIDDPADAAIRQLWRRLEEVGVPSLATHTHGRHVPHLTLAALRTYRVPAVQRALAELPVAEPAVLHLDALGAFRRSRCWLAPAASGALVSRQEATVAAALGTGAELHRHYRPGVWVPHLTLAPRLHTADLPTVARVVYDVLPLTAQVTRAALIETATGDQHPLDHLV